MGTAIHEPWELLNSSGKQEPLYQNKQICNCTRFPSNRNSIASPAHPNLEHTVIHESLRIDCPSRFPDDKQNPLAFPSRPYNAEFREATNHKAPVRNDEALAFVALLRGCAKRKDLYTGSRLHEDILKKGLLEKCSDALVTMYAKCGMLAKAEEMLEMHESRDVITWTALIAGFAQAGKGHEALTCFERMQHAGVSPNAVTFSCVLKACGSIRAAEKGEEVHEEIARQGLLGNNIVLGNALVDMYCKCGALLKARQVLDNLPFRDVISWSALIAGYAQNGQGEVSLNCYEQMQHEGISPNSVTFLSLLKACSSIGANEKGKQIHDEIARQGLLAKNIALGTALVDMYVKCGALDKAQQVLEELPSRDVISWNPLIAGYAHHGLSEQALNCFRRMKGEGLSPNATTFTSILKACSSIGAAEIGAQIHHEIASQGLLENNVALGTAVIDMYAKCGAFGKAKEVLKELPSRDVTSWNALISGYSQQCQAVEALNCFEQMQREGISPNEVTFTSILKVCSCTRALDRGEQVHDEISRQGLLGSNVLGTALMDMYAKCGALAKAEEVLDKLPSRDIVTWSALIAGYAQHGHGEQALNCLEKMKREGITPNSVTYISILKACSTIGAADKGKQIHDEIARQGLLENDIILGNALVDMYAKCGALEKARQLLEELPSRNVISWSALMAGYSKQGQAGQVLTCFDQMQQEGIFPNAVTFSCVLNACSNLGLVDEGHAFFVSMSTKYGLKPDLEHYSCIIDLFGRAGHLDKAVRVIQEMPSFDHSAVWAALLGACQKWGDVNVGKWVFEHAVQADRHDPSAYVLMANIYSAAGMQFDAASVEALRLENRAWIK